MNDLDSRLKKCFAAAFPDLRESTIPQATVENTVSWDSMGGLTLASVIEEEFGVALSDDVMPELRSYARVREEVAKHLGES